MKINESFFGQAKATLCVYFKGIVDDMAINVYIKSTRITSNCPRIIKNITAAMTNKSQRTDKFLPVHRERITGALVHQLAVHRYGLGSASCRK